MSKILIHTTSIIEANPIIDFFNLKELENTVENKIYSNDDILLIISGVSKDLIVKSLDYIFKNYSISKAFDLSIASCSDGSIALGTLFCTNRFPDIFFIFFDKMIFSYMKELKTLFFHLFSFRKMSIFIKFIIIICSIPITFTITMK
jgi:hypothetical protein